MARSSNPTYLDAFAAASRILENDSFGRATRDSEVVCDYVASLGSDGRSALILMHHRDDAALPEHVLAGVAYEASLELDA